MCKKLMILMMLIVMVMAPVQTQAAAKTPAKITRALEKAVDENGRAIIIDQKAFATAMLDHAPCNLCLVLVRQDEQTKAWNALLRFGNGAEKPLGMGLGVRDDIRSINAKG